MQLRILSIGRDRTNRFEPIVADYMSRLDHYLPNDAVIAGEAQGEDATARKAEAKLLRKRLHADERFVALDERGEQLTSHELAVRFAAETRRGCKRLVFVLGGPSGFDPEFLSSAAWKLSLSKFTLPHQLARVVLAEQLYRAQTILRGEPYSK